mmetsp:Transcript_23373/g.71592  ORF Transcript_23373/g.71592 Transcript_23373/m.71592 type:complete len:211 (-) Transcript_23373:567-1199(-)
MMVRRPCVHAGLVSSLTHTSYVASRNAAARLLGMHSPRSRDSSLTNLSISCSRGMAAPMALSASCRPMPTALTLLQGARPSDTSSKPGEAREAPTVCLRSSAALSRTTPCTHPALSNAANVSTLPCSSTVPPWRSIALSNRDRDGRSNRARNARSIARCSVAGALCLRSPRRFKLSTVARPAPAASPYGIKSSSKTAAAATKAPQPTCTR